MRSIVIEPFSSSGLDVVPCNFLGLTLLVDRLYESSGNNVTHRVVVDRTCCPTGAVSCKADPRDKHGLTVRRDLSEAAGKSCCR